MGLADRDIQASQVKGLHADWRFTIAYNAALQAATAALAATGHRATRDNHHYRVIQSLELTIQPDAKLIRRFDAFRKKRNSSNYEAGGSISDKEAEEMKALATTLRADVERWIREKHPQLL